MSKTDDEMARAVAQGIRDERNQRENMAGRIICAVILCIVAWGVAISLTGNGSIAAFACAAGFVLPFILFARTVGDAEKSARR